MIHSQFSNFTATDSYNPTYNGAKNAPTTSYMSTWYNYNTMDTGGQASPYPTIVPVGKAIIPVGNSVVVQIENMVPNYTTGASTSLNTVFATLDDYGNIVTEKAYNGTFRPDFSGKKVVDSSGNIYAVSGATVMKFDSNLNFIAGVTLTGKVYPVSSSLIGSPTINDIDINTVNGNITVVGLYQTKITANYYNGFEVKFDSNLSVLTNNVYQTATPNLVNLTLVKFDSSGNKYIAGYYKNSSSQSVYFVQQYNNSGTLQWGKSFPVATIPTGSSTIPDVSITSMRIINNQLNLTLNAYYWNTGTTVGSYMNLSSTGTISWQRKYTDTYIPHNPSLTFNNKSYHLATTGTGTVRTWTVAESDTVTGNVLWCNQLSDTNTGGVYYGYRLGYSDQKYFSYNGAITVTFAKNGIYFFNYSGYGGPSCMLGNACNFIKLPINGSIPGTGQYLPLTHGSTTVNTVWLPDTAKYQTVTPTSSYTNTTYTLGTFSSSTFSSVTTMTIGTASVTVDTSNVNFRNNIAYIG